VLAHEGRERTGSTAQVYPELQSHNAPSCRLLSTSQHHDRVPRYGVDLNICESPPLEVIRYTQHFKGL
jgi:hypothetical protein